MHLQPLRRLPVRFLLILAVVGCGGLGAVDAPQRSFHFPSLYHVGFWVRDLEKSRAFYHDVLGFEEPYLLNHPDGTLQMVVMKVNERQVIYLFPNAAKILPNGDNLDHLGLETDNIAAARAHLLAAGIKVGEVNRGRIGDLLLGVKDPDGHTFELTQFAPEGELLKHQGKGLPTTRVSAHLRSATLTVANLSASLHFYVDVLGFEKIAAGRGAGDRAGAVRVRVSDGTDYLELVPVEQKPGAAPVRAVPEFCLDVADAAKTAALLTPRAKAAGLPSPETPSTDADGARQIGFIDPDGTRVVLKEAAVPR